MNSAQYSQLFSFLWNIANDVLVNDYEKHDYKSVILPFIVLRRLDILLEPTKDAVLAKAKDCERKGLPAEKFLYNITGYPFYNVSNYTMTMLKSVTDPQRLMMNMMEYLNGFSPDVKDIVENFDLPHIVEDLTKKRLLGAIIAKFTDTNINLSIQPIVDEDGKELQPALDNHTMGTLFEQLLRKFNEETQVTSAGEHFTPRDYVHLLADLAVLPIADRLEDTTYNIYDGACGTGGILTVAQEEIQTIARQLGKTISVRLFGQELTRPTYATCKADLMMSGEIKKFTYREGGQDHQYICQGSTISADGHAGEAFDFCISNPPFGEPWKKDLQALGIDEKKKKEFTDLRFWHGDTSFIPDIGDAQMLFLANNVSRMKNTPFGTRIVEVHNGSSLFTGKAGGGESNLRKYIIENDLLEAIIAMPENDFYNTGIGTYIWVVTNRKEERRKGKVQLIDATALKHPLRKNLGKKNCETNEEDRAAIMKLYMDFEENEQSRIFPNEEFGYWEVQLEKPERDEDGNPLKDRKGNIKYKKVKGEVEQIPLLYPGGIQGFYEKEVKPYDSEVRFLDPVVGYELSFTKYFYKPVQLKGLSQLTDEIIACESTVKELLDQIFFDHE
ncbi:MAG: type I restriction-modification system subunit M [Bacteroidales bacterium]|nr:type I restriction-modification system subunit M [Bacteroidales bacterium]